MNWQKITWWPFYHGRYRHSQEALFQRLRVHLTLWYCGVLGAALVLFGIAIYLGVQYFLLSPIESDAAMHAQKHADQWVTDSPDHACPAFGPPWSFGPPPPPPDSRPMLADSRPMFEMMVCFDQNGSLLPNQQTTGLPSAFLTNTLAKSALQTGQPATDVVNASDTIGSIYRYALVVPNPLGGGNEGVILIGEPIQAQETALSLLLTLLLTIGSVALLGAGLGGLFLANHALAPARLAWANQQRFIADASHELRTPLTLLRADAEVLLREGERFPPEDAALLEDIVAEANHMARLATNLLTLARLDNTSLHQEHEVVSLAKLAQETVRRVQAFAGQRSIMVQLEGSSNPYVIGDPMLLEQAVLVLLDNAIKYNQQGGCVTVYTTVQDGQGILEVRDTGIGIASEHLSHLGERFYRVDKARSREAGGTGLGLSIARSIAHAHGGQLTVTSIFGKGTTVTLTLPLAARESNWLLNDIPE